MRFERFVWDLLEADNERNERVLLNQPLLLLQLRRVEPLQRQHRFSHLQPLYHHTHSLFPPIWQVVRSIHAPQQTVYMNMHSYRGTHLCLVHRFVLARREETTAAFSPAASEDYTRGSPPEISKRRFAQLDMLGCFSPAHCGRMGAAHTKEAFRTAVLDLVNNQQV